MRRASLRAGLGCAHPRPDKGYSLEVFASTRPPNGAVCEHVVRITSRTTRSPGKSHLLVSDVCKAATQWSTEVPLRRSALSVCPCGGPLGDTPPIKRNVFFLGPCKASKGTNTKVTSAKGHFCAYPSYCSLRRSVWLSVLGAGGITFLKLLCHMRPHSFCVCFVASRIIAIRKIRFAKFEEHLC